MKITCVIPARLMSTRLPKKMLMPLSGKPLLQWVIEAAKRVSSFDAVVVATDHPEVGAIAQTLNVPFFLTSPECLSGTDRLIELQKNGKVKSDIWVNWQGDEPFITPEMIDQLLQSIHSDEEGIWTLCKRIVDEESLRSPHIVKVVRDEKGRALYFSRSLIPHYRENNLEKIYYKHIGLYAFSNKALTQIGACAPTYLEESEKLEQLRFLSHGLSIKAHETFEDPIGIDTAKDLALASSKML